MSSVLRVLMVEDSEEDAALTLRALRAGGYRVECQRVDHADAFRAALAARDWDLVLSDHETALRGMQFGAKDYILHVSGGMPSMVSICGLTWRQRGVAPDDSR